MPESSERGDGERREWMWERYGKPESVVASIALRVIGQREQVHPRDTIAFLYRDQEAAAAYAESNLEYHGHPTLGTYSVPGGVVGVLDIRQALTDLGREVTDPSEPDGNR